LRVKHFIKQAVNFFATASFALIKSQGDGFVAGLENWGFKPGWQ
jgi:hypothetical protein